MASLQSSSFVGSHHRRRHHHHHHHHFVSVGLTKIEMPKSPLKRTCINNELLSQSVRVLPTSIFKSATTSRGRKRVTLCNSWISSSEIASTAFTLGTVAVLPFYAFMIVAPRAPITKRLVESSMPYVLLGILYAYLLCLSWTPDTFHLMFASKYWLPEVTGIASLFSSEMTLASAWIHLLVVDLYAARQVYNEGLKDDIETRHSVSLCLLFCPIGILSHSITKAMTRGRV